jgi:hypothetical protein
LNISVFPSSFVSVCSLSLPSDACQWHGSALRVVLATAVALFLCIHSQHLILLWSLPLAAPVLVQEKRQACVDVMHIPRDVISVLMKRGDRLDFFWDNYFKTSKRPVESSDAHAQASSSSASSSSAPPGPDHGSTNALQAPEPNPTSSTTKSNPLMEPPSPSSSESLVEPDSDDEWWYEGDGDYHGPPTPQRR